MITGGCLCGGVGYEISGKLGAAVNCHCSICRRHSGAALLIGVIVPRANFKWTKGQKLLRTYQSSQWGVRIFCGRCGSNLASAADPEIEPVLCPPRHHRRRSWNQNRIARVRGLEGPWFEITDKLRQHETHPPQG
jgi:hypothetical protein